MVSIHVVTVAKCVIAPKNIKNSIGKLTKYFANDSQNNYAKLKLRQIHLLS